MIKNKDEKCESFVMMGDPFYLILFVVDFSNMSAIKGTLKYKIEHKLVIDSKIDKNNTGVTLTSLTTKSL